MLYEGLCPDCWTKASFINRPFCHRCCDELRYEIIPGEVCHKCQTTKRKLDLVRAVFKYDFSIKQPILRYKNLCDMDSGMFFSRLMAKSASEIDFDYLVAVPLHYFRLLWRGYNQSSILANMIADQTGKSYLPGLLRRSRFTGSQGNYSGKERRANVTGAFEVKQNVSGKRFLIVDDVYTTGSTLEECATVLKRAGAKSVSALVIAKT